MPVIPITEITIETFSVELDNGENLRDLAIGDSVDLRPDTGHPGLWIAATFHGDFQDRITLQAAETVVNCSESPAIACRYAGTAHAHPVDVEGGLRKLPA